MIIVIILSITLYILSIISMYCYFRIAFYHSNGIYNAIKPSSLEIIIVFTPIINTCFMFMWITDYPTGNIETNFFKPKTK